MAGGVPYQGGYSTGQALSGILNRASNQVPMLGQLNQGMFGRPPMPRMQQGNQFIPGTPYPFTRTPTYQAPMPRPLNFSTGAGKGGAGPVQADPTPRSRFFSGRGDRYGFD